MKISKALLKQIITEEVGNVLPEGWQTWADQVGWSPQLEEFPPGRTGELLELFYGDLSFEGATKMGRRIKRARKEAARAKQESHSLSSHAASFSQAAHKAYKKAEKEEGRDLADIFKDPPAPDTPGADFFEAALDYERAAKRKEVEVDTHADANQEHFDLLDIYDSLVNEDSLALQVAEEMIDQYGQEAMSSLAISPNLRDEFINKQAAHGMARAKEVVRTQTLPDKWE